MVEPFSAGPHRGTIVRTTDPEYGPTMHIVVDVGRTRVDISADIPERDVVAALATLAPLDLASQPVVQVAR